MTEKDSRFYFANFAADILRCAVASAGGNRKRYRSSLIRLRSSLKYLRKAGRPEAYEEALLLMLALKCAKEDNNISKFKEDVNRLISSTSL